MSFGPNRVKFIFWFGDRIMRNVRSRTTPGQGLGKRKVARITLPIGMDREVAVQLQNDTIWPAKCLDLSFYGVGLKFSKDTLPLSVSTTRSWCNSSRRERWFGFPVRFDAIPRELWASLSWMSQLAKLRQRKMSSPTFSTPLRGRR